MEPKHHAPSEVAEKLGVSTSTVWRLIRTGELPSVKATPTPGLKPRTRVLDTDLQAFVRDRTHVA